MSRAFVLGLFDTGLGVVRALAREGVEVCGFDHCASQPGFHSRFGQHEVCPDPVLQPNALTAFLLERARHDTAPPVLYPTSDAFVSFVSTHREALEPAFRHALPSRDIVAAALDKSRQYALAKEIGIATAATHCVESLDELRALMSSLAFPVVVKPHVGHLWYEQFRKDKALLVQNANDLLALYREIFAAGQLALVQSFIVGPNTNHCKACAYIDAGGNPLAVVCMQKVRQYPVDFGVGTMMESVDEPQVAELGLRFYRAIGWRGPGSIEFKRDDRDGLWKLIELNPRLWQQNGFATDCGTNFPLIQHCDLTGRPQPPQHVTVGMRWLDEFRDPRSAWAHYQTGNMSIFQWLASYGGVSAYALFARDDLGPFARVLRSKIGALYGRMMPARSAKPAAARNR